MKGVKLNVPRNQWKAALSEVIASQGEEFLPKREIISRTAAKVGYAASAINPMALAAYKELEHEGKVEEFHPEGRGNTKACRLVVDGKRDTEDTIVSLFARASDTSSDEEEVVDNQDFVPGARETRENIAEESPPAADMARLCAELFAFFEKTGEGLIDMARAGKTLIEDFGRAKASASPPSRRHQEPGTALESKVDRLSEQIAALSELLGVQKREFEARQAGILSMLEEEARRRGNGAHRQEGRRGDSDKNPAGMPWRSG